MTKWDRGEKNKVTDAGSEHCLEGEGGAGTENERERERRARWQAGCDQQQQQQDERSGVFLQQLRCLTGE